METSSDGGSRKVMNATIDEERDLKHIFVLSSSGKPVFTRHGDEQELVTTFGLLQAMASVIQDAGDEISTIQAGSRRIVYFMRGSLYFVSISSSGEPEAVLWRQLEFIHNQILFILTTKIHDVLRMNAAKDIRDLLGYDSMKLMHESCKNDITPSCIAFNAVNGFVCATDLRDEITGHLKKCIDISGAALGIILYGDMLCSYSTNVALDLELSTDDVLLLTNFVGHSKSLQSQDQNWIPLCLPAFNSRAYLQAYTCNIKFNFATSAINSAMKNYNITLILIATSADSKVFSELHEGRQVLERDILRTDIPQRLLIAVESQQAYLSTYAVPYYCMHFVYVIRPQLAGMLAKSKIGSRKKKTHTPIPTFPQPAQCHSLCLCPEEGGSNAQSESDRILVEYHHLALRLRCGSSLPEHTLLTCNDRTAAEGVGNADAVTVNVINELPPAQSTTMTSSLSSGVTIVCIGSREHELYAAFPPAMSPAEAVTAASSLSDALSLNNTQLFNMNYAS